MKKEKLVFGKDMSADEIAETILARLVESDTSKEKVNIKVRWLGPASVTGPIFGKVYDVLGIEMDGIMYRIVDESGEDYLYPKDNFEIVDTYNDEGSL